MRRQFADYKFLQHIDGSGGSNSYECIFKCERRAAIGGRIISIRDSASSQASQNVGIVRLPAPIVALAPEWIGECVAQSGLFGS